MSYKDMKFKFRTVPPLTPDFADWLADTSEEHQLLTLAQWVLFLTDCFRGYNKNHRKAYDEFFELCRWTLTSNHQSHYSVGSFVRENKHPDRLEFYLRTSTYPEEIVHSLKIFARPTSSQTPVKVLDMSVVISLRLKSSEENAISINLSELVRGNWLNYYAKQVDSFDFDVLVTEWENHLESFLRRSPSVIWDKTLDIPNLFD